MPTIQFNSKHNTIHPDILPRKTRKRHPHNAHTIKIRRINTKQEPRKCIQATIIMVANKKEHTVKKPKNLLIPVDMNDPALDGLPVMFHDKETGIPSFTKGDMVVPTLESNTKKKRKHRKKRQKINKKTKKNKQTTSINDYLKSFSIST